MSEHLIEDLVADSVRALDDHAEAGDPRVRDWCAVLRAFDENAPGFEGYGSWLEDGCVEPPFLYYDAGTALWRRRMAAGALHGSDAVPPRRTPLIDVVREIALAVEKARDRELVGLWYAFGRATLLGGPAGCPFDVDLVVAALAPVVKSPPARRPGPSRETTARGRGRTRTDTPHT